MSEILAYVEDSEVYINELGIDKLAAVINEMDADDAVDFLEDIDEGVRSKLRPILDEDVKADIRLIESYDEDEIGSLITTNFICIKKGLTIRQAMHELIVQAGDNDNIGTIYVVDEKENFCGAIDLKDLIVAREGMELDSIIVFSYPYLYATEKISESIEKIKDYAKLAGLFSEEDLQETTKDSMKKRLPWLIILLFLGMGVSAVVGAFEDVVAMLYRDV